MFCEKVTKMAIVLTVCNSFVIFVPFLAYYVGKQDGFCPVISVESNTPLVDNDCSFNYLGPNFRNSELSAGV